MGSRCPKEESKLTRQITAIEGVFNTLEGILGRVVFFQYTGQASVETHFGKLAFYRSKARNGGGLNSPENILHIDEYLTYFSVYSLTTCMILASMKDSAVMNRYDKRLEAEKTFIFNYILPTVQKMKIEADRSDREIEESKIYDETLRLIDDLEKTDFSGMIFKKALL